jgi:hypothetical protein
LPILVPSEIGIGHWGPKAQFQEYVIRALERAAQGYSAYCYGEMMDERGEPYQYSATYRNLTAMVEANQDVCYRGLPGPGDVAIRTGEAQAAQVHDGGATVAMLHFPGASLKDKPDENMETADVRVEVTAGHAARYSIETWRQGKAGQPEVKSLEPSGTVSRTIPAMAKTEAVFVRVKRLP